MGKLLKAYIMPHPPIMIHEVGRGRESEIENTIRAAQKVADEIKALKPDTIIILVPPHGPAFSDAVSINIDEKIKGDLGNFGAHEVKFDYEIDLKLTDMIMRKAAGCNLPVAPIDKDTSKSYRISNRLDHGSMVPLYFIDKAYKGFNLVHITYGLLSNEELYHFGSIIKDCIEEWQGNVVFIASGDLSHRLTHDAPAGFSPLGEVFDKKLVGYLESPMVSEIMEMDRETVEGAGECGYRTIIVLMGLLDRYKVEGSVLSYEGPFGVGYCIAKYDIGDIGSENNKVDSYYRKKVEKMNNIRQNEDVFVKLARQSLEYYIRNGRSMDVPEGLPDELTSNKSGAFVSLRKNNQLRGCIGTIEAVTDSIAEEIIENAISAGTRDPRFYPVDEDELDELVYSVDILGEAEPINSKAELDPKRYGIIVRKGRRSALLLPNLEGVDTIDEQLHIVLQKAGIDEDEGYSMERFEVIRHK